MSEHKNFFARAFDAMVEARKRQAEHEMAVYRRMFEYDGTKSGR